MSLPSSNSCERVLFGTSVDMMVRDSLSVSLHTIIPFDTMHKADENRDDPRKCHLEYARSMHTCASCDRRSWQVSMQFLSADQTHDVHLCHAELRGDDLVYVDIFVICRSASLPSCALTTASSVNHHCLSILSSACLLKSDNLQ